MPNTPAKNSPAKKADEKKDAAAKPSAAEEKKTNATKAADEKKTAEYKKAAADKKADEKDEKAEAKKDSKPGEPTEKGQSPAAGDAPVEAKDISHPSDVGEGTRATKGVSPGRDDKRDEDNDSDPVADAWNDNPVVQTYDKSAGDPTKGAPDYDRSVGQGGVRDMRSDNETQYKDAGDYPTPQHVALYNETHPQTPVEPGEGPDEGQVLGDVDEGPSVVQGTKDTVPDPPDNAMSLEEQVERGIGVPTVNVETPGYERDDDGALVSTADKDDEDDKPGRDLTGVEQDIADGGNNPQHGPVKSDAPAGSVEGPRDAKPDKYASN